MLRGSRALRRAPAGIQTLPSSLSHFRSASDRRGESAGSRGPGAPGGRRSAGRGWGRRGPGRCAPRGRRAGARGAGARSGIRRLRDSVGGVGRRRRSGRPGGGVPPASSSASMQTRSPRSSQASTGCRVRRRAAAGEPGPASRLGELRPQPRQPRRVGGRPDRCVGESEQRADPGERPRTAPRHQRDGATRRLPSRGLATFPSMGAIVANRAPAIGGAGWRGVRTGAATSSALAAV